MYNVSQNFLTAIKQAGGRQFKASVTINGQTFDDNNIVEIGLVENCNPTESFILGGTGSTELELELINLPTSLVLNNAPITATISTLLGDNVTWEDIPLGIFTVETVEKNKSTVKLTCFDNMYKLELPYFSDLAYPATIQATANEICTKAGIQLVTTLPNTLINKIVGYSYREAISFIASFLGGFAHFNRLGKLEIRTYVESGISVDGNIYYPPLKTSEKPFTIGNLVCKVGDTTLTAGSGGNGISLENPIMTQDQLNSIYNTLKTLSYMPYTMDWIGNQAIEAGDKITITDDKGNAYNTLVMENKLIYKGSIKATTSAVGKTETGQNFNSGGSIKNSVDRMVVEQANIKLVLANTVTTDYLNANYANISTLNANYATITNLNVTNGKIDNLSSTYATIAQLNATNANITSLTANKANVTDLTASNGRITTLESTTASINTLLAGNIGAENIKTGTIVAGSTIVANGAIGSAQISSLDVVKLNAGTLDTSKITIAGANSRLKITGNRLQVFATKADTSLYERVSLGDVNGDGSNYGFRVRGADGTTVLLDETGVKREGITDGSVNNAKIGSDANISGTKLDIVSVVTAVNNGTTTIQGSKVYLNNSTLDVQFNNLSTTVTNQDTTISSHTSSITALNSSISLKVDSSTYNNKMTSLDGSITSINSSLSTQSSSISVLQGQIVSKVSQTDINNSINAIQIGGRNLVPNSQNIQDQPNNTGLGTAVKYTNETIPYWRITATSSISTYENIIVALSLEVGQIYTISCDVRIPNSGTVSFYAGIGANNNIPANVWTRIYYTFTYSAEFRIAGHTYTGTQLDYRNWKLENGTKPTDWIPAPEDVQGQIDSATTRISTAETSITQLNSSITLKASQTDLTTTNNNVSGLTTRMSSAESTLSVQAGQIATKVDVNGVKSTIEQNSDSVKIGFNGISDNLIVDSDGLKLTSVDGSYSQQTSDGFCRIKAISGIRYVRDWCCGNSKDTLSYWDEIKVMAVGVNIAAGLTPTCNFTGVGNIGVITDNAFSSAYYSLYGNGNYWVQIDLKTVRTDVSQIIVSHTVDKRVCHGTYTEVSDDGIRWIPVYDSKIQGGYTEETTGKIINITSLMSVKRYMFLTYTGLVSFTGTSATNFSITISLPEDFKDKYFTATASVSEAICNDKYAIQQMNATVSDYDYHNGTFVLNGTGYQVHVDNSAAVSGLYKLTVAYTVIV